MPVLDVSGAEKLAVSREDTVVRPKEWRLAHTTVHLSVVTRPNRGFLDNSKGCTDLYSVWNVRHLAEANCQESYFFACDQN